MQPSEQPAESTFHREVKVVSMSLRLVFVGPDIERSRYGKLRLGIRDVFLLLVLLFLMHSL